MNRLTAWLGASVAMCTWSGAAWGQGGEVGSGAPPSAAVLATTQPAAAAPATTQPADPAAAQAARQAYVEAVERARLLVQPAEGVALWEKYLADYPRGLMTESGQRELGTWKDRAEKDLLRFGPGWLPRAEVDKHNAKADELISQADAAAEPDKTVRLLTEASKAHPYRADIHFRKFQALYKAGREKEASGAMGAVLRIDPQSVPAMNNIGVMSVRTKEWANAIALLSRAAGQSDNDAVWDNLDQAMATAQEGGYPAAALAAAEGQMRGLVARVQKAGKHAGETRWGNGWISQAEYADHLKDNQETTRKIQANLGRMRQLGARYRVVVRNRTRLEKSTAGDSRPQQTTDQISKLNKDAKDLEAAAQKLKDENDSLKSAMHQPNHAGKLVVLNLDGGELESIEPVPPPPANETGDKPDGRKGKGGGLFD